jgi:hypothetical protein
VASYTLSNYWTRVSAKLGLDNSASGDRDLITHWVSEAQEDFIRRTHCKVAWDTVSLTSGTTRYTLPTQLLAVLDLYSTSGNQDYSFERVTLPELQKMLQVAPAVAGPTRYYATEGFTYLHVYPAPGSSDSLTLVYVPKPTALSASSDVPSDVPTQFHRALEYFALAEGEEFDNHGPSQFGAYWLAKYEQMVREARSDSRKIGGRRHARAQVGRSNRYVNRDPSVITH